MSYLFDTNVIIYYINGVARAREIFATHAPEGISISVIVYMEVLDGIPASPNPRVAGERFANLVDHVPLIGFEHREAERCVEIRQQLRHDGREWRRRAVDLMIAATALEHGLVLVSNNPGDYADIAGLEFEPADITSS